MPRRSVSLSSTTRKRHAPAGRTPRCGARGHRERPCAARAASGASGSRTRKVAPWPGLALELEAAAVARDDLLRLREADARAALLGREERVEDAFAQLVGDAGPGVGDREDQLGADLDRLAPTRPRRARRARRARASEPAPCIASKAFTIRLVSTPSSRSPSARSDGQRLGVVALHVDVERHARARARAATPRAPRRDRRARGAAPPGARTRGCRSRSARRAGSSAVSSLTSASSSARPASRRRSSPVRISMPASGLRISWARPGGHLAERREPLAQPLLLGVALVGRQVAELEHGARDGARPVSRTGDDRVADRRSRAVARRTPAPARRGSAARRRRALRAGAAPPRAARRAPSRQSRPISRRSDRRPAQPSTRWPAALSAATAPDASIATRPERTESTQPARISRIVYRHASFIGTRRGAPEATPLSGGRAPRRTAPAPPPLAWMSPRPPVLRRDAEGDGESDQLDAPVWVMGEAPSSSPIDQLGGDSRRRGGDRAPATARPTARACARPEHRRGSRLDRPPAGRPASAGRRRTSSASVDQSSLPEGGRLDRENLRVAVSVLGQHGDQLAEVRADSCLVLSGAVLRGMHRSRRSIACRGRSAPGPTQRVRVRRAAHRARSARTPPRRTRREAGLGLDGADTRPRPARIRTPCSRYRRLAHAPCAIRRIPQIRDDSARHESADRDHWCGRALYCVIALVAVVSPSVVARERSCPTRAPSARHGRPNRRSPAALPGSSGSIGNGAGRHGVSPQIRRSSQKRRNVPSWTSRRRAHQPARIERAADLVAHRRPAAAASRRRSTPGSPKPSSSRTRRRSSPGVPGRNTTRRPR